MKKIYKIVILSLLISSGLFLEKREVSATTSTVSSFFTGEMHLTEEGSPYLVPAGGGIFMHSGNTLTIDPGVTLLFPSNSGLFADSGAVLNIGNPSSSKRVVFDLDRERSPNSKNWIGIDGHNSFFNFNNVDVKRGTMGISLDKCTSTIFGLNMGGLRDIPNLFDKGVVTVGGNLNLSFSNLSYIRTGVSIDQGTTGSITNNIFYKNNYGLFFYYDGLKLKISNNTFLANKTQVNSSLETTPVDVSNNYWGDPNGPSAGAFVGKVNAFPWLNSSPQNFSPCCSSVLFIPGFEATRLFSGTNQLWEPNRNADVDKLAMDSNGKSIDPNIKVGEIIKRTNIGLGIFDQNIYAGIANTFDGLVKEGKIQSWKAFPYDWRSNLSLSDPIFKTISDIADLSYTGKVTLVGHSNGGLFVKEIANIIDASTTSNKIIDSLVLVATPQIGTPSTLGALLHGDEQSIAGGFILNKATARAFGKNVPVAYNLLPSNSFYPTDSSRGIFPIRFASSTDLSSNLRKVYGDTLNSFSSVLGFLKGSLDGRSDPSKNDTDKPAILNQVLLATSTIIHNTLLDNLSIKNPVFQIGGTNFPTTEAIEYSSKRFCLGFLCLPNYSLTHKNIKTNEGDGVVSLRSALFSSATSYSFDLGSYNVQNKTNISHSNFLEAIPVRNLIYAILTRDYTPPVSFVKQAEYKNITPPTVSLYRYRVDSKASLDAYDSAKRHTGKVSSPNAGSDLYFVQSDIPNSVYEEGDQDTSVIVQGSAWPITLDIKTKEGGSVSFDMTTSNGNGGQEETNTSFVDVNIPTGATVQVVVDPYTSTSSVSATMNIDTNSDGKVDKVLEAPLQGSFPPPVSSVQEDSGSEPSTMAGRSGRHRRTPEYMEYIRKFFSSFNQKVK